MNRRPPPLQRKKKIIITLNNKRVERFMFSETFANIVRARYEFAPGRYETTTTAVPLCALIDAIPSDWPTLVRRINLRAVEGPRPVHISRPRTMHLVIGNQQFFFFDLTWLTWRSRALTTLCCVSRRRDDDVGVGWPDSFWYFIANAPTG